MAPKETPPTDYAAERETMRAEHLALTQWYTDVTDEAILSAAQDFTSSAKAAAYARQAAKKADADKFSRLQELDLKYSRWYL